MQHAGVNLAAPLIVILSEAKDLVYHLTLNPHWEIYCADYRGSPVSPLFQDLQQDLHRRHRIQQACEVGVQVVHQGIPRV
jgi:hypothetical protein